MLKGRRDTFAVETDVHFQTDINLLHDAVRKTIDRSAQISEKHALGGWRQSGYNLRQFKKSYRKIQRLKHSTSKDETLREAKQQEIRDAHKDYSEEAAGYLERARQTRAAVLAKPDVSLCDAASLASLDGCMAYAERQIDQIRRRVLEGEVIAHDEKVFSIFEPHTEWIGKGKAGVPVELGVWVCVLEDRHRFILHHQVLEKLTDDKVATRMVDQSQASFPTLRAVSFDKGFHSPPNRQAPEERLEMVAIPKKGRCSAADRERETAPEFVEARHKYSAVGSAINGLEHFGLDLCPDHGIVGFKRYVALAVLREIFIARGVVVRERNARTKAPVPEPQPMAA